QGRHGGNKKDRKKERRNNDPVVAAKRAAFALAAAQATSPPAPAEAAQPRLALPAPQATAATPAAAPAAPPAAPANAAQPFLQAQAPSGPPGGPGGPPDGGDPGGDEQDCAAKQADKALPKLLFGLLLSTDSFFNKDKKQLGTVLLRYSPQSSATAGGFAQGFRQGNLEWVTLTGLVEMREKAALDQYIKQQRDAERRAVVCFTRELRKQKAKFAGEDDEWVWTARNVTPTP
ncbi:unnamed protein product, partial [Prorocentrum cordatum]